MELRERLTELKESRDYSKEDIMSVTEGMLDNIGDLDPVLRDDLIYTVFARMILNDVYSKEQLKHITQVLLDKDHLFCEINENSNKVYTRTFSVLMLAPLVYKHRQDPFYSSEEVNSLFTSVVDYFIQEQNLNGYNELHGWAHSVAHTADVFDELALCNEVSKADLSKLLDAIQRKIAVGSYVYRHGEDDRLVTALSSVFSRELFTNDEIIEWIRSFDDIPRYESFIESFASKTNIKNLMRSLYFTLFKESKFKEVCDYIVNKW